MTADRIQEIQIELSRLAARKDELECELRRLQELPRDKPRLLLPSPESKVDLFVQMFRCRESVYPRFWENHAKGIRGYSPACDNEWVKGVCGKPPHGRVRCSECPNQAFPSLDEAAVRAHLNGKTVIGTYAIREDDTCVFLACDFDGSSWREDAFLYQRIAAEIGVEALVERSRSGVGAHVWIFFDRPVPARMARALGTMILAKCGESDHRLALSSFDRFFPNQDYLPKGGFGNLIALPFQHTPSQQGNTLFIDESYHPIKDQWAALACVKRVSPQEISRALGPAHVTRKESLEDDLSLNTNSRIVDNKPDVRGLLAKGTVVRIRLGSQLTIPIEGLPSKLVTALQRLATFANPEFFRLQRMRMATYPHPRFIFSGEKQPDLLLMPRGLEGKIRNCLERAGAQVEVVDDRCNGFAQDFRFIRSLTVRQQAAASELLKSDSGVFVAPPGSGKTVVACALIGERNTSTLVLVHKQPLIDQWRTEITTSLGLEAKQIGILGGSKRKRTGILDIAMLQSLVRSQDCAAILSQYGLVVIDECHHVPASSFEAVMKQCAARFVMGLTATPRRKDSLEVLLYQHCGPIRHEIKIDEFSNCSKHVTVRKTAFRLPESMGASPPYHLIAELIATDRSRNRLIADDIVLVLQKGRYPVVLADRRDQVKTLQNMVLETAKGSAEVFCLEGIQSAKRRRQVLTDIDKAKAENIPVALLATASLIGEGFNLPDLDTLVLASPISFEGRLIQYVGRLQRSSVGKTDVTVFDYVDESCAVLLKMYRGRMKTYQKLGYEIPSNESTAASDQPRLF